MAEISWEFGFHPEPLELTNGDITIQPLQNHTTTVAEMENWEDIEKDWVYAPRQPAKDFMTGVVTEKPYSARVFGLPKTHRITHNSADNEDHLTFHLWCLSFFSGLRLTATEAGFLDATPLKAGKLVDFVPMGGSLSKGLEAAEAFWINNRTNIRQTHRLAAAIHALFLAQYPPALQFERFLNLYAALDACYAITA